MIRLNDVNKTVIDEKEIKSYSEFKDNYYDYKTEKNVKKESIVFIHGPIAHYDTKEARDKDLELLDKLLDVKNIEDKANAYPHEIDALKFAMTMSNIKEKYDPVKKEEYITWEEVKNSKKKINIKLPNGDIHNVGWDEGNLRIQFFIGVDYEGCIYEEDLFNALMLKKVE